MVFWVDRKREREEFFVLGFNFYFFSPLCARFVFFSFQYPCYNDANAFLDSKKKCARGLLLFIYTAVEGRKRMKEKKETTFFLISPHFFARRGSALSQ